MKTVNFCHRVLGVGIAAAILAACGGSQSVAPQLPAAPSARSQVRTAASTHARYTLVDLGTFGGPSSYVFLGNLTGPSRILTNAGTLVGRADTSTPDPFYPFCFNNIFNFNADCFLTSAFVWRGGAITALPPLAAGNSAAVLATSVNSLFVGIAQNGQTDPLVPGFPEFRAVTWGNGAPINLGTLGGNESLASAINSRGNVAGWAVNTTPDTYSFIYLFLLQSTNGTQTHAFLYKRGVMNDLGTLGGPDSAANYVNERGDVAGTADTSYVPDPYSGIPPFHPVLWQNGRIRDLGTLGGGFVGSLNGLNERGEVIGSMTLAGDATSHPFLWDGKKLIDLGTFGGPNGDVGAINDAGEVVGWGGTTKQCQAEGGGQLSFLWKKGVKINLGAVPGTDNSDALGVNSRTQIVGDAFTCDLSVFDAYLWQKGTMIDLNTVIPPSSALHLSLAQYINERGEITGLGTLPNGDFHAFVLIPNAKYRNASITTTTSDASQLPRKITPAEITVIRALMAHRHFGHGTLLH